MILNCKNTFAFLFVFVISFSYSNEVTGGNIEHLRSMYVHANKLVRENNYETAMYFYDNIFEYIDSIEAVNDVTTIELDSLKTLINNHYINFEKLISELEISFDTEDKLFCFDKKDFDLLESDNEKIDFQPFPEKELKMVMKYVDLYTKRQRRTAQTYLNRSALYIDDLKKIFSHFGMPEELAYIPMAESGYVPFAHSYAKAAGLWQFIPSTAKTFGLKINWWEDERKDVIKSSIAAAKFLKLLYKEFEDWNLVLAAYNCGQGGVNKRIKKHNTKNFWSLYTLPKQTKDYVPKIRALVKIAKDPEQYKFSYLKESVMYDTVMLDSCIRIKAIADCAEITYEDVRKLNPALRQWCLPPYAKNYTIVIPAESKIAFRKKLTSIPAKELYPVIDYKIKKGDTLKKIADEFKINISGIKDLNAELSDNLTSADSIKVIVPPLKKKWFTEFNNKYLTYYDDEPYYLEGRDKLDYRVKNGDSVWSISRKFKVKSEKLKVWNKIGKNNIIKPGQNLVIYL